MKISIAITVLNEEKTMGSLLDSLLGQSKKADEIIVVDGGSKDKTLQIIKHYQKKYKNIKLLVEKGNVAHGRNTGIEIADNDIIATTDAGCIPHKDWLEKITGHFTHLEVGLVAGFYDMPTNSSMQKAVSVFLGVSPERFDPATFIPSARSMAFRKNLWEEVGGFNEKLKKAGEDTLLFYNIVKTGTRIVRVGEARVDWRELENITFKTAIRKFFDYAKGDAQSKIWRHPTQKLMSHNIKVVFIFIRYLFGLFLLFQSINSPLLFRLLEILIVLYLFWPVWKWRDVIDDFRAKLWLPVIQISSDFAVMAGFTAGMISFIPRIINKLI